MSSTSTGVLMGHIDVLRSEKAALVTRLASALQFLSALAREKGGELRVSDAAFRAIAPPGEQLTFHVDPDSGEVVVTLRRPE